MNIHAVVTKIRTYILPAVLLASGIALFASVWVIFHATPTEVSMGFVQKIFYFHLPPAILGYVGFTICCVASIVYLVRPSVTADCVAQAGAAIGVLFCGMVLISGPLWAKKAWGQYWSGEPRLTLTLALFVIFVAYILVRSYGGTGALTRRIGAVLAIFGFADIPLIRYAVTKWGGSHPPLETGTRGGMSDEMWLTMRLSFIAFALLFASLFWLRLRLSLVSEAAESLHVEIGDRELLIEDMSE